MFDFVGQQIDILLGDSRCDSGEMIDFFELAYAISPEQFNPVVISDVTVDRFGGMVGFNGDFGCQIAFQVEGDDFSFMGNGSGEVMYVATRR